MQTKERIRIQGPERTLTLQKIFVEKINTRKGIYVLLSDFLEREERTYQAIHVMNESLESREVLVLVFKWSWLEATRRSRGEQFLLLCRLRFSPAKFWSHHKIHTLFFLTQRIPNNNTRLMQYKNFCA